MQPILGRKSRCEWASGLGQRGFLLLSLLLGVGIARADSTNFVNDFREAFWTNQVQWGSTAFSNSSTELVVLGPTAPPAGTSSLDGILYNGPLGGGLLVGGTVEFQWAYSSGDTLSQSAAEFIWLPPGGGPSDWVREPLASGGTGFMATNLFFGTYLAGTVFEFSLSSDTPPPPGKPVATLTITDFKFYNVPEPAAGVLLANALAAIGAASWWRSRKRGGSGC